MNQYCFFNGQIMPLSEAKISITDIGLLRGYGVYDGLTAHGDKIFRYADHWERFVNGAHTLNLNIPITEDKCENVIKELLSKHGYERSIIQMILTGGPTISGIEYNFETPTFFILIRKWEPLPGILYEKGGKLTTYNFKREFPEIKTTNYINAVNLQNFRKEEDAIEILYTYDGEVYECATSNFFLVKDGVVVTPAEEVLGGITRKVVMELVKDSGMQLEGRRVFQSEMETADEIFLASSFKDILPITKVDDYIIGSGEVGPITKDLIEKFKGLIS